MIGLISQHLKVISQLCTCSEEFKSLTVLENSKRWNLQQWDQYLNIEVQKSSDAQWRDVLGFRQGVLGCGGWTLAGHLVGWLMEGRME